MLGNKAKNVCVCFESLERGDFPLILQCYYHAASETWKPRTESGIDCGLITADFITFSSCFAFLHSAAAHTYRFTYLQCLNRLTCDFIIDKRRSFFVLLFQCDPCRNPSEKQFCELVIFPSNVVFTRAFVVCPCLLIYFLQYSRPLL